jgi:hypothetical protein
MKCEICFWRMWRERSHEWAKKSDALAAALLQTKALSEVPEAEVVSDGQSLCLQCVLSPVAPRGRRVAKRR